MVSNEDKWVRIFDIPDISKHNKGFTIYKIISMLYPKNCPDSVTKVTVWKRYNDFKKLHHDIKGQHKTLKMKVKFPSLPSASYFKRFDDNVIQQRRDSILKFLEFVAAHPQLFSSDVCVKFFKTSYTPSEVLNSNIHSIRAELNLPVESDYDLVRSYSDEEHSASDTDSVSTLSSTFDHLPDPLNQTNSIPIKLPKKLNISISSCASSHDSLSISTANISLDGSTIWEGQSFPTPPHTPNSISAAGSLYYIVEASQYITQAVEFEISRKYEEAFAAYKMGIDILLRNVKDDKDYDRREMVRHKIEKYLLRAEKIYNVHLSPDSKTIQNYVLEKHETENENSQQSVSDLYKYKVLKIISSGMLVLHSDSQQLFYIKVIHKTSRFSNDKLILPGNVPYMIKLYNYYNCENALFLVLQYCNGIRLDDYIKQTSLNSEDLLNYNIHSSFLIDNSVYKDDNDSECDSDHSYTDLIHDYATSRFNRLNSANESNHFDFKKDHSNTEGAFSSSISLENYSDVRSENSEEIGDLVVKSKDLLSSVKLTLKDDTELGNIRNGNIETVTLNMNTNKSTKSSRKSSERSELSLPEDFYLTESILPLQDIIKWSAQLLLTLERLHALNVICCDLQMKNLLIDDSGDLVLTYMCNVSEKYDVAFTHKNDLTLAPEMYGFQPITDAVDWWSYGAILYEMLVGMSLMSLHPEGLSTHTVIKIPKFVSVEARSLVKQLLAYETHERLGHGINGAEDIKSHPFFNSVAWEDLASKCKT